MIHTRFEVTLLDPLIDVEALYFIAAAEVMNWDLVVAKEGRILVLEGPKTIKPVIKWLAEHDLGPDVGLIRKIVDYDPDEYENEFVEYYTDEL